jgi:phenylalanyl-tRNA synthetase beta chain
MIVGDRARVELITEPALPWLEPFAALKVNGRMLGTYGMLTAAARDAFDIDHPIAAAELGLAAFFDAFPPEIEAHALPSFPAIERDLSAIVDETLPWAQVHDSIVELQLDELEAVRFVTTFRGKQIGGGRKSLTLRLRFRAPDRTLTHEEVDPQTSKAMAMMAERFNAEFRR